MENIKRLATSINYPEGNGIRIVPTVLGKIQGICRLNHCAIEDPKIHFTQKTWDVIVCFQSAHDDKTFGWEHNKFMKPMIVNISEEERISCLEELIDKVATKKESMIKKFGELYMTNKDIRDKLSLSSYGWNLIKYFDGFCGPKTISPPQVTILGEITPMIISVASV